MEIKQIEFADWVLDNPDPFNAIDPKLYTDQLIDPDLTQDLDKALEEQNFRELFYSELITGTKKVESSILVSELNQLGEGDKMSIRLNGKVDVANKQIELGAGCEVEKSADDFIVTVDGKIGVGFIKELATKFPGGDAKLSLAAMMGNEGKVRLTFPNAKEVEKAVSFLGKAALTSSLAVPIATTMPPMAYLLSTQGSGLPLVGKYLVDLNNMPDIDYRLSQIEGTASLFIQGEGELDGALPIKDLSHLFKGGLSAKAKAGLFTGAVIDFEGEQPELIMKSGLELDAEMKHKLGVGKHNSISSTKKDFDGRVQVFVEHRYDFQNDFKSLSDIHKTVVRISYESENNLTKKGNHTELIINPSDVGDVYKLDILKEIAGLDFENAGKVLKSHSIPYEIKSSDYEFCGQSAEGRLGRSDYFAAKGGYEYQFVDVDGDDGVCD